MAAKRCQICGRKRRRSEGPGGICRQCTGGRDSSEVLRLDLASRQHAPLPGPSISQELPPLPSMPKSIKKKRFKFRCSHCKQTLRIPAVKKRTRVRCPQCAGDFYVFPDGHREELPPEPPIALAIPVKESSRNNKRRASSKTKRSQRRPTVPLNEGEIIPHRTVTRSGRQQRTIFESGDFDGSATGFDFESVTGLEDRDLDELRFAAGVSEAKNDPGYLLLPPSDPSGRSKRRSKKRRRSSKKKHPLHTSNEEFRILPGSDEESPSQRERRRRLEATRKVPVVDIPLEPKKKSSKKKSHSADEKRRKRKGTGRHLSQSSSRNRASSRLHELSGETISDSQKRSPMWIVLLIMVLVPVLFFSACLSSTTRDQGFAATGSLGQNFDKLGQSVQKAVRQLRKATGT